MSECHIWVSWRGFALEEAPRSSDFGAARWRRGCQYWSMTRRTGIGSGSAPPASGPPAVGTVAAYAAALVAFAYALVSLYWAVGGRGLTATIGGYVEQMARHGGATVVLLALAACSRWRWSGLGGGSFRGGGC
jgi:hypothetical protein